MKDLSGIKNIIFDLGGVLLNLDPGKTLRAFKELGLSDIVEENVWSFRHEVFILMEKGLIADEDFIAGVKQLLPVGVTDKQIEEAWTAMLLDIPEVRVRIVLNLKKHFNTYLFSNTNTIHVKKFQDDFRKAHHTELCSLFVKYYYSNEIKLRKPDIQSFAKVIQLARVQPQETLFIDDSEENIKAAQQAGLKTIWLQPNMKLEELFVEFL